jgi:hypothetical protein
MKAWQKSFLYRNSLSIALVAMLLLFWFGQFVTGMHEHNKELVEYGKAALPAADYFVSGHFMSATFENWESEFLQMAMYVVLTIFLRQQGSSESKKLPGEAGADAEEVDRIPKPSKDAPWPVNKGGIWLVLYKNSLSIAFALLFLLSFTFHFTGSFMDYNEMQALEGKPLETAWQYMGNSHFWFESFQNWQSEFLAVASIVVLSIWLRQQGSPESKPVDTPYMETGK